MWRSFEQVFPEDLQCDVGRRGRKGDVEEVYGNLSMSGRLPDRSVRTPGTQRRRVLDMMIKITTKPLVLKVKERV